MKTVRNAQRVGKRDSGSGASTVTSKGTKKRGGKPRKTKKGSTRSSYGKS